jgi:hypothetical protein
MAINWLKKVSLDYFNYALFACAWGLMFLWKYIHSSNSRCPLCGIPAQAIVNAMCCTASLLGFVVLVLSLVHRPKYWGLSAFRGMFTALSLPGLLF